MTAASRWPREALRQAMRVYAVTPSGLTPEAYQAAVTAAIAGGVTAVQYRDKSAREDVQRADIVRGLLAVCREAEVLFIVNDRWEMARDIGADGVHLGPDDALISQVRQAVGDALVIGGSTGDVARAKQLVEQGADYLGVGAIFDASATKPNASAPRGTAVLERFRADAHLCDVPLVAIGGIDVSNAGACVAAGADGVASVRAVFQSADVAAATARLASVVSSQAARL